jgi:hypothetical protein
MHLLEALVAAVEASFCQQDMQARNPSLIEKDHFSAASHSE